MTNDRTLLRLSDSERELAFREDDFAALVGRLYLGGDPNERALQDTTTLYEAIRSGRHHFASVLIKCGANPDSKMHRSRRSGLSPMDCAAFIGSLNGIRFLKSHGADVNGCHDGGDTPLFWAARGNQPAAIKLLCELGANVNYANRRGSTALHATVDNTSTAAAKALIKMGADPALVNDENQTPWSYACRKETRQSDIEEVIKPHLISRAKER